MTRYLQRKGFSIIHRRGSHVTLQNDSVITVVPIGNTVIPIGTLHAILSYADISRDEFMDDYNNGLVK